MNKKISARNYVDKLLERAQREPNNVELHINIGEACLRDGDTDGAFKAFNRAAELDPSSYFRSLVQEWSGYIYKKAGRVTEAITAYTQWAQIDRLSPEPLDRWGSILASENMWVDLLLLHSTYKKRLEQTDDPQLRTSLALLTFALGQEAVDEETSLLELASSVLEVEYDSLPMRYLMGLLYMRLNHWESADSEFKKVLELDTEKTWRERRFDLDWSSDSALLMRGRIAHIQQRYDQAFEICYACLKSEIIGPLAPLEEIISMLMEQGAYHQALDILESTSDTVRAIPLMRRLYSRCLLGAGRIEEASKIYEKGDALDPSLVALAKQALSPQEQEALSLESETPQAAESGESTSQDADLASNLLEAELTYDSGDFSQAAELYANLLTKYPTNDKVALGLAKAQADGGHLELAIATLESQLERLPQSARDLELWKALGNFYQSNGDTLKYRLSRIQIQSLSPVEDDSLNFEIITPAIPDSGLAAVGISARAVSGSGNIVATGIDDAKATIDIAWTYLRAEAKNLGLPDPSAYDFHIHLRDVSGDLLRTSREYQRELGGSLAGPDGPYCSEDIGLGVLLALVGAMTDSLNLGPSVVGGRLDLQGRIYSSPTLALSLQRMYNSGLRWKRLVLPRTITTNTERLPQSVWSTPDLILCSNAKQAIRAWRIDS